MDTLLNSIKLSNKQILRLCDLKSDVINGFSYWPSMDKIVVVSTRELTEKEKNDLNIEIAALPDTDTQSVKELKEQAEIEALIEKKKHEIAIDALKNEGKLDKSGKIVR